MARTLVIQLMNLGLALVFYDGERCLKANTSLLAVNGVFRIIAISNVVGLGGVLGHSVALSNSTIIVVAPSISFILPYLDGGTQQYVVLSESNIVRIVGLSPISATVIILLGL